MRRVEFGSTKAAVGMWSLSQRLQMHRRCLGLVSTKKWQRLGLGRVTSQSRLFTSRAQDVIFDQIMQATLVKWAKSVAAIYHSVNRNRFCIIITIINGREKEFTSAIIITCRPILTSRDLQTSRFSLEIWTSLVSAAWGHRLDLTSVSSLGSSADCQSSSHTYCKAPNAARNLTITTARSSEMETVKTSCYKV